MLKHLSQVSEILSDGFLISNSPFNGSIVAFYSKFPKYILKPPLLCLERLF